MCFIFVGLCVGFFGYFYSCVCVVILLMVWFVFGNVLVIVLCLSSRFIM